MRVEFEGCVLNAFLLVLQGDVMSPCMESSEDWSVV